jgi:hypothetical protein
MRKIIKSVFFLLSITMVTFLTGCTSNTYEGFATEPVSFKKVNIGTVGSNLNNVKLVAGQSIDAGSLIFNDIDTNGDNLKDALEVTFSTKDGWELSEVHFFIGTALSQMPQTKTGNPQVGLFPYKSGVINGTSYTFIIPFATLNFDCTVQEGYFVSAHASVKNSAGSSQTAWGDGLRLNAKGNWGMYFMIYISCDESNPPVDYTTETAFAYNSQFSECFSNFSVINSNRWGWTNGPLSPGNFSFDIYAAAGQCDISRGTKVGNLSVNYSGSSATFTINIFGVDSYTNVPYSLKEFHLYAGSEPFPRNNQGEFTIAPGQYPYKAEHLTDVKTYTFVVNNLSGDINFIAHATVLGFPNY